MEQNFWREKLSPFIIHHPQFVDLEIEEYEQEDIYTPREGLKIRFWFEGNIQIEGEYKTIEINFNSYDVLILSKRSDGVDNIFRIPWKRLISFELIIGDEASQKLKELVRMN
jgi:hypothetical protein